MDEWMDSCARTQVTVLERDAGQRENKNRTENRSQRNDLSKEATVAESPTVTEQALILKIFVP